MAYLPLSTANLPDPAIDPAQGSSPTDYFNTVLYTGNGTSKAVTGVGFQPDFVWVKGRPVSRNHSLSDAVRGTNKDLMSNSTSAELSDPSITSFDSDGFTAGAEAKTNNNGENYVAWNWKANGSGVSNTDGSITSTVSANTESGFSIVSWTSTGSTTVGHGLEVAPDFIIIKARNSTDNWVVGSSALGWGNRLRLNTTDASSSSGAFQSTAPTSSVFYENYAASSRDKIAYCFHSVEGFSKFGSYTGNGSTDGTFVYTGFRPAFVMVKRTDTSEDWWIKDSVRGQYNPDDFNLFPNSSNAESTSNSGRYVDLLSNGFKPRGTNFGVNESNGTYIYMAFAENPFKYSNAR